MPAIGLFESRLSTFNQFRSFRFRRLIDVRSYCSVNRKRSFAGLVSLFPIVARMCIRLSIDASHPQRFIQLPCRCSTSPDMIILNSQRLMSVVNAD